MGERTVEISLPLPIAIGTLRRREKGNNVENGDLRINYVPYVPMW
jgi:hypothetical protein